jgi:hypothetical protein
MINLGLPDKLLSMPPEIHVHPADPAQAPA